MGILRIDQVASGMVVAAEIRAYNGRLLIAAGNELSENQLLILRTWGIQEIDIAGAGVEEDSEPSLSEVVSSEQLERASQHLDLLFSLANCEHPVVRELFRLAVLRRVRNVGTHGY